LRVLFLENHPMWIHGLPGGFRDLGHEVMISGPITEATIQKVLEEFQPHMAVLLGWTQEHTPFKLSLVFKYVKPRGIPLVFWATEDPTHTQASTLPLIRLAHPDFVFTICPSSADDYTDMGMKAARLDFGYHPAIHHRTGVHESYRCGIAVVANAYPDILAKHSEHYRITSLKTLIEPLVKQRIRVDFWGRDWNRMQAYIGFDIPAEWIHGYADYTQANRIYSSADIVIGLQNHLGQLTQRTYEILGSEGFLLTSDTPEIRRLFEPGKDLVVSASPAETVDLARYYACHPEERESIRKQGAQTVAPHAYQYRARQMIETLKRHGLLDSQIE
jgi:spore maturation protein CgeB